MDRNEVERLELLKGDMLQCIEHHLTEHSVDDRTNLCFDEIVCGAQDIRWRVACGT